MSIFTAARKITAARITGAVTAAGIISYITKEAALVCPIAGAVIVGAAIAHRKLVKDDIKEVSASALCVSAGMGAVEVGVGSAAGIATKRFINNRMNKTVVSDTVEQTAVEIPAEAVDVVTA